jgi:hypothetical protein
VYSDIGYRIIDVSEEHDSSALKDAYPVYGDCKVFVGHCWPNARLYGVITHYHKSLKKKEI